MAAIDWPTTLPTAPSSNGFLRKDQDNRIVSENDIGPKKVRRRSTVSGRDFSVSYELTAVQLGYLSTFWTDTINCGTEVFDWVDPITGSTIEVMMMGSPEASPLIEGGLEFSVSITLQEMPA